MLKNVNIWIYHIRDKIDLPYLAQMKQKNFFFFFSKGLHIYNEEAYKNPNYLKENTFEIFV